MTTRPQLLIYGANGYTGTLIARRAAAKGLPAVLAGRRAEAVSALAGALGSPSQAFDLEHAAELDAALQGIAVVLNCAGPFSRTAAPLVQACLRARAHYLDITGELGVLEALSGRDDEAKAAGITVLPGAGFDVVPSDCLAAHVQRRLPSATHLTLAFETTGRMSRGTATTAIEEAHGGGVIRREGRLVRVPSAWRTRTIDFGAGPRRAVSLPWGDVATAYHTTGIGNIEVYAALPALTRASIRMARWAGPLLASPHLQRLLKARVQRGPAGPSDAERARGGSRLWAEATDGAGQARRARLQAPEPYELTSWTALELAERALRGELPPGFQTPARACGPDFVLGFPGVAGHDVA
jgi:short subunit dehydrogenase-like uncharacterized protein